MGSDSGHRTGGGVVIDGRVWPTDKAWPKTVIDGFLYLSDWKHVYWDVYRMMEAHAAGELGLIVWYETAEIVGANVIKFVDQQGGTDMELLSSYAKADGRIRAAGVLDRLIELARSKGCASVSAASGRRIDKILNRRRKNKRQFKPVETLYRLEINGDGQE